MQSILCPHEPLLTVHVPDLRLFAISALGHLGGGTLDSAMVFGGVFRAPALQVSGCDPALSPDFSSPLTDLAKMLLLTP
jgi:hypothetical protein